MGRWRLGRGADGHRTPPDEGGGNRTQQISRPPGARARMRQVQAAGCEGGPETIWESDLKESCGGRQWLTWEVIMMLESIRKLMAKCRKSACLDFPLPKATAPSRLRPHHTHGLRPGATTRIAVRQPDAIKLRPSHPISGHIQCFPPPVARNGRRRGARERSPQGRGQGDVILGAGLS